MSESDWKDVESDSDWVDVKPAEEKGFLERAARAGLKTLPAIGAVGGGILGAAAGGGVASPVTGVVGAGLGMGMGKSLQSMGEMALGDEMSKDQYYKDILKSVPEGAAYEMGGQVIGAVPGLAKQGYQAGKEGISKFLGKQLEYTPAPNLNEVMTAAKALGVDDVPMGLQTSNQIYRDMESGLSQSGSIPALGVRKQYNKLFDKLKEASEKITGLRSTSDSTFASGKGIQTDLAEQVQKMKEPVSEMYQSIQPHLQKIQVNESVVNKAFGALKKNPIFQTKDGKAILEEYKAITKAQPELASLKELRTSMIAKPGDTVDAMRINELRNAVTSVRNNTIEALKAEMPKGTHGEIDDLIAQISLADKAHASNISDVNSIKGVLQNKDFNSPSTFLTKLKGEGAEDLAKSSSNLDIQSLRNMKDKFPTVFEKAKQAKIDAMLDSAENARGFGDATFLKKYNKMDQELKDLIFDKPMQDHIQSFATVRKAIPEQLGPSGTPKGLWTMEMANLKRGAMDLATKTALDAASGKIAMPVINASGPRGLSRALPMLNVFGKDEAKPNYNNEAVMQKIKGTKYEQVLNNAKQKGEHSAAAAHYVLSSQDKTYRELLEKEGE